MNTERRGLASEDNMDYNSAMRLYPVSDLHNESLPWSPPGDLDGVLLVAGDIHTRGRAGDFLREAAPLYKHVVAVLGNHDHWDGAAENTMITIRASLRDYPNVHVLDKDTVVLDGVRFVGCTLWTHVPPDALMSVQNTIRDYERIRIAKGQTKLNVGTTNYWHTQEKAFLETTLQQPFDGPTVVVTHHAPSAQSIDARYKEHASAAALNHGYHTHLDQWASSLGFDVWIHGHTHHSFQYEFGPGQLVCNPRGYAPAMVNPDFNERLVLDPFALHRQRRPIEKTQSYEDFWATSGPT